MRGFGQGDSGPTISDNEHLKTMLGSTNNRWAAATVGSRTAGALELATGKPIMSIGGFMGGDNSPTLEQFQTYTAQSQIHYFIVVSDKQPGAHLGPGGDSGSGDQITQWVQQHFTAQDLDGATVYDLSQRTP